MIERIVYLTVMILLVSFLLGCGSGREKVDPNLGVLSGRVYLSGDNELGVDRGHHAEREFHTRTAAQNAIVSIIGQTSAAITTTTDKDGMFYFLDLTPGTYRIEIVANEQTLIIPTVTVEPGQTTYLIEQNRSFPKKAWNFLVYLNADNDLEFDAIKDINEMEQVGSDGQINILVLVDRINGYDSSNGDWTDTRLYYVTQDNDDKTITSSLISCWGELDMSNPDTLTNFLIHCQEHFPADHTLLTLWNHGAGVYPKALATRNKGISFDYTSGITKWFCLTTDEVATALFEAEKITNQKVDIVNMDACLMQMLEVAYEWRDLVNYIVGSEETVPGPGNNYTSLLARLKSNTAIEPEALSRLIVEDYYNAYRTTTNNTTYSSISLSEEPFGQFIETFTTFAKAINEAANNREEMELIYNAWTATTSFEYLEFRDLMDFLNELVMLNSSLSSQANALKSDLRNIIINHKNTGLFESPTPAYGLSILFPSHKEWGFYSSENQYKTLELSQSTEWDEFIIKFQNFTRSISTNKE